MRECYGRGERLNRDARAGKYGRTAETIGGGRNERPWQLGHWRPDVNDPQYSPQPAGHLTRQFSCGGPTRSSVTSGPAVVPTWRDT